MSLFFSERRLILIINAELGSNFDAKRCFLHQATSKQRAPDVAKIALINLFFLKEREREKKIKNNNLCI